LELKRRDTYLMVYTYYKETKMTCPGYSLL